MNERVRNDVDDRRQPASQNVKNLAYPESTYNQSRTHTHTPQKCEK